MNKSLLIAVAQKYARNNQRARPATARLFVQQIATSRRRNRILPEVPRAIRSVLGIRVSDMRVERTQGVRPLSVTGVPS